MNYYLISWKCFLNHFNYFITDFTSHFILAHIFLTNHAILFEFIRKFLIIRQIHFLIMQHYPVLYKMNLRDYCRYYVKLCFNYFKLFNYYYY